MTIDEHLARALGAYEQAVFGGDRSQLDAAERGLDAAEADVALARGQLLHARYSADRRAEDPAELASFERADGLYRRLGDRRGEGEALFWIGIVWQVIRDDDATARPLYERSLELATSSDDTLTMSYALRHLGISAHQAGDLVVARERLEESTRLRRDLGFTAGVAANLVGLAYLAAAQGRSDDARTILDEAADLARTNGAHGIATHVDEARAAVL